MRHEPDSRVVAAARACLRADAATRTYAEIRRSLGIPHVSVVKCYARTGYPIPPEHLAIIQAHYLKAPAPLPAAPAPLDALDAMRAEVIERIKAARTALSDVKIARILGVTIYAIPRWMKGTRPQAAQVERAHAALPKLNVALASAGAVEVRAPTRDEAVALSRGVVAGLACGVEEGAQAVADVARRLLSREEAARVLAIFAERVRARIRGVQAEGAR